MDSEEVDSTEVNFNFLPFNNKGYRHNIRSFLAETQRPVYALYLHRTIRKHLFHKLIKLCGGYLREYIFPDSFLLFLDSVFNALPFLFITVRGNLVKFLPSIVADKLNIRRELLLQESQNH